MLTEWVLQLLLNISRLLVTRTKRNAICLLVERITDGFPAVEYLKEIKICG